MRPMLVTWRKQCDFESRRSQYYLSEADQILWKHPKSFKMKRDKNWVWFAHLWCTIAPRWFPTERKENQLTSEKHGEIMFKSNIFNICSRMKTNVSVLEGTGADGYGPANPSCWCLTHSRGLSLAWKSGLRVYEWVFQSEAFGKRERQQPGQWLLVLNWILTGSTEQGSCRVTGGCAAMDVNTWVDI